MNVFIRADASYKNGSGHIMRCLTIATHLRKKGINVIFISRQLDGDLCKYVEEQGFKIHCLLENSEESFNWEKDAINTIAIIKQYQQPNSIIVDHYLIDEQWELKIRSFVKKIMVIDDLANRKHHSDILLDQNLYEDMQTRYDGLVSKHCGMFLGPRYVLLREEFLEARTLAKKRENVKRIMVFFGGSDPTNETLKVLESLQCLNLKKVWIDVVVGKSNLRKEEIESICNKHENMHYYCQIDNMAELMVKADLAIGAGGATMWERCYLGLPTIVLIIAENQSLTTKSVEKLGAIINLGNSMEVTKKEIGNAIEKFLISPSLLKEMSLKAQEIVGTTSSINTILNQFIVEEVTYE